MNYRFNQKAYYDAYNNNKGRKKTPESIFDLTKDALNTMQMDRSNEVLDLIAKLDLRYTNQASKDDIVNMNYGTLYGAVELEGLVDKSRDANIFSNPTEFNPGEEFIVGSFIDSIAESKRRLSNNVLLCKPNSSIPYNVVELLVKALDILQMIFVPNRNANQNEIYNNVANILAAVGLQQNTQNFDEAFNVLTSLFGDKNSYPVDTICSLARVWRGFNALAKVSSQDKSMNYGDTSVAHVLNVMTNSMDTITRSVPFNTPAGWVLVDNIETDVIRKLMESGRLKNDESVFRHFKKLEKAHLKSGFANNPYADLSGQMGNNGGGNGVNPNAALIVTGPNGVSAQNNAGQQVPVYNFSNNNNANDNQILAAKVNSAIDSELRAAHERSKSGQCPDPYMNADFKNKIITEVQNYFRNQQNNQQGENNNMNYDNNNQNNNSNGWSIANSNNLQRDNNGNIVNNNNNGNNNNNSVSWKISDVGNNNNGNNNNNNQNYNYSYNGGNNSNQNYNYTYNGGNNNSQGVTFTVNNGGAWGNSNNNQNNNGFGLSYGDNQPAPNENIGNLTYYDTYNNNGFGQSRTTDIIGRITVEGLDSGSTTL